MGWVIWASAALPDTIRGIGVGGLGLNPRQFGEGFLCLGRQLEYNHW